MTMLALAQGEYQPLLLWIYYVLFAVCAILCIESPLSSLQSSSQQALRLERRWTFVLEKVQRMHRRTEFRDWRVIVSDCEEAVGGY